MNQRTSVFNLLYSIAMFFPSFWARHGVLQSYHLAAGLDVLGTRVIRASPRGISPTFLSPAVARTKQSHLHCVTRDFYHSRVDGCTEKELVPFEECWKTTSLAVNPSGDENIDIILQGLNSPAPQSFFVLDRAIKTHANLDFDSFEFALRECSYLIKRGWKLMIKRPKSHGDFLQEIPWTLLPPSSKAVAVDNHHDGGEGSSPSWIIIPSSDDAGSGPNACQLSIEVLSIVSKAADAQQPIDEAAIESLVHAMVERLQLTLGTDIRGRTSADTAFHICLAGIQNEFLYDALTKIARLEMERVGQRQSRRAKDILQVVEKLAAAGIRGPEVEEVYQLAGKSLASKVKEERDQYPEMVEQLSSGRPGRFNLLSPRPLLWLWRYSSRLQKPSVEKAASKATVNNNNNISSWWQSFEDPSRPLVIDIGCGLGVSLIGLASHQKNRTSTTSTSSTPHSSLLPEEDVLEFTNNKCNYLGGDLNQATVRFANSVSSRWNLTDRLCFVQSSAGDLLESSFLEGYPGRLSLVLIQFPSPWRLGGPKKQKGNSQLPSGPDDGFMVSTTLLNQISKVFARTNEKGYLLLQTNCEDVAVTLRDRITQFGGLEAVPARYP
eukprot:scaffold5756_cov99-Cylindrotheca_fusiformis.AAC.8